MQIDHHLLQTWHHVCLAGVEVPFELCVVSSHPLELCELPRQCTIRHASSWGPDTAGGSNLHSSWLHNPAFTLQLERKALCRWVGPARDSDCLLCNAQCS